MRRLRWTGLCLLLAAGLAACQSAPAPAPTLAPGATPAGVSVAAPGGAYTQITPQTLAGMLAAKDFFFVNTHIPYEGEIEPTDAFIPYDEITQRLSEFPADKSAMIVLYCSSGRMSAIAAQALVAEGYTNVWDLAGGFTAWQSAGFDLVKH